MLIGSAAPRSANMQPGTVFSGIWSQYIQPSSPDASQASTISFSERLSRQSTSRISTTASPACDWMRQCAPRRSPGTPMSTTSTLGAPRSCATVSWGTEVPT